MSNVTPDLLVGALGDASGYVAYDVKETSPFESSRRRLLFVVSAGRRSVRNVAIPVLWIVLLFGSNAVGPGWNALVVAGLFIWAFRRLRSTSHAALAPRSQSLAPATTTQVVARRWR